MGVVNTSQTTTAPPVSVVVVVAGGVDPGGGAGLLRDVAAAAARGARAHAIGTAWTEQGEGVHRVEPRDPAAVRDALRWAIAELRPAAVKVGMAVGPATAAALVEGLAAYAGPVVVDPVLATSRGGRLWAGAPGELLPLLRRATLVTPNAIEAGALAGTPVATITGAEAAGRWLVGEAGVRAALVKGGHLPAVGGTTTDVLVTADGCSRLEHPHVGGVSMRGTGCALATAIAIELGRGAELRAAAATAGSWLGEVMAG
jgi:hydroxymethylpyrimidine/phosphomethylpyrimidine kinase